MMKKAMEQEGRRLFYCLKPICSVIFSARLLGNIFVYIYAFMSCHTWLAKEIHIDTYVGLEVMAMR